MLTRPLSSPMLATSPGLVLSLRRPGPNTAPCLPPSPPISGSIMGRQLVLYPQRWHLKRLQLCSCRGGALPRVGVREGLEQDRQGRVLRQWRWRYPQHNQSEHAVEIELTGKEPPFYYIVGLTYLIEECSVRFGLHVQRCNARLVSVSASFFGSSHKVAEAVRFFVCLGF